MSDNDPKPRAGVTDVLEREALRVAQLPAYAWTWERWVPIVPVTASVELSTKHGAVRIDGRRFVSADGEEAILYVDPTEERRALAELPGAWKRGR